MERTVSDLETARLRVEQVAQRILEHHPRAARDPQLASILGSLRDELAVHKSGQVSYEGYEGYVKYADDTVVSLQCFEERHGECPAHATPALNGYFCECSQPGCEAPDRRG